MKKSLLALLITAPLALSLTGCVVAVGGNDDDHNISTHFKDREYKNRKAISTISLRSSIADVTNRLGISDFNESYEKDGKIVKVLFYRTNRIHKDGLTTKDECTYLYFEDGLLVETGSGGEFSRNVNG